MSEIISIRDLDRRIYEKVNMPVSNESALQHKIDKIWKHAHRGWIKRSYKRLVANIEACNKELESVYDNQRWWDSISEAVRPVNELPNDEVTYVEADVEMRVRLYSKEDNRD